MNDLVTVIAKICIAIIGAVMGVLYGLLFEVTSLIGLVAAAIFGALTFLGVVDSEEKK